MAVADSIIVRGMVLTQDPQRPRAEAIALAGARILSVGTEDEVRALAGPETEVIDAGGCTVLPGFVESHLHLFIGGA
ncbi:Amidohydrolase family protein [Ruegeria marina]|uniref:Amidohydrolase family protein n=1 Tax=Ruegeria marina TaxID=639004 RepID=A0A1G6N9V2_9RHOB|nr:Amidohydrolase family protein [Ruegeria marina]